MLSGCGGPRGSGVLGGVIGACCWPASMLLPSNWTYCKTSLCCIWMKRNSTAIRYTIETPSDWWKQHPNDPAFPNWGTDIVALCLNWLVFFTTFSLPDLVSENLTLILQLPYELGKYYSWFKVVAWNATKISWLSKARMESIWQAGNDRRLMLWASELSNGILFFLQQKTVRCLNFKMLYIFQHTNAPETKSMALISTSQRRCKTTAVLMNLKVPMKRLKSLIVLA